MRVLVAVVLIAACDPYQQRSGEYFAGAVDPAAFPAPYLGAGGDPKRSGGVIAASAATAHGAPAPYYAFAVSAAQAGAADPLAVASDGSATAIPAPLAYVLDPRQPGAQPFPATPRCTPPSGYRYDPRRDGYRLDDQGNVFTALPASGYAPVVAEVPVTSNGEPCQSIKSAATLLGADDVLVASGGPDGRLLAWAIVDPGAEVRFPDGHLDPSSGLGPQHLGWFDHYLVAYLDGGYVPTSADAAGTVHVVPQNLYFPTAIPTGAGQPGDGFDLLDAARGEPGYSPLCRVLSFVPADPQHPPTSAASLDPAQLHDTGSFVWCLQVAP